MYECCLNLMLTKHTSKCRKRIPIALDHLLLGGRGEYWTYIIRWILFEWSCRAWYSFNESNTASKIFMHKCSESSSGVWVIFIHAKHTQLARCTVFDICESRHSTIVQATPSSGIGHVGIPMLLGEMRVSSHYQCWKLLQTITCTLFLSLPLEYHMFNTFQQLFHHPNSIVPHKTFQTREPHL